MLILFHSGVTQTPQWVFNMGISTLGGRTSGT